MKTKEKQKIAFCCPHHGVLQNSVEYISADIGSQRLVDVAIMYCHECDEYYTPFTNLLAFAKLEYKGKKVRASQGRADKAAYRIEVKKPYYVDIENENTIPIATESLTRREDVNAVPNLSKLDKEQIEYLCQQMSPKDIRSYFQKFPKDFTRIRPGFRPNALSDVDTINLMIRNCDKPFIRNYIDNTVKQWLKEIDDYRKEQENDGRSSDESLLMAIPQSFFAGNVELYLLLSEQEYPSEYVRLLKSAASLLKKTVLAPTTENANNESEALEVKIGELTEEIERLNEELSTEKKAHSETATALTELTAQSSALEQSLAAAEARIDAAATKTVQMQEELELLRKLAKYADSEMFDTSDPDYEYTSICQVYSDYYSGQIWLTRLADIYEGKVSKFNRIEDQPYYFGNRDRLFWRDGPKDEGYIGVWRWNAVPNKSDPSSDYVTTSFSKYGKIIEIIELPDCRTYEDICKYLSENSISYSPGRKYFFALCGSKGNIPGLLCNEENLEIANGTAKLKATTCVLPQFIISASDIVTVAGKKICRFTTLGTPQDIYHLKSPFDVVKDIVVSRATSTVLRQQGLTRKEAQHCQLFLMELPVTTLEQDVANSYGCSEAEAAEYMQQFLEFAETYLDDSDLDVGTLSAALTRSPEMVKKCKQLLESEWRAENEVILNDAMTERERVYQEAEKFRQEASKLQVDANNLTMQLEQIEKQIEAKLQLATDVESKVADRIAAARSNVADFICEMAFVTGREKVSPKNEQTRCNVMIRHNITCEKAGEITDLDMFEEELACNFNALGYNAASANNMAQIVTFCICNRQPILCGSNAPAIADAISSLFHCKGAFEVTFPLASEKCNEICESMEKQCEEENAVVLINGAFDGYCMNSYAMALQHLSNWKNRCIPIFSIMGVNPETIPTAVWDTAWLIDGDSGLTQFPHGSFNGYDVTCDLTAEYRDDQIKSERKKLKQFLGILSNRALLNYAGFIDLTGSELKKCDDLILQFIIQAKAQNKLEEMSSLLETAGIDITKSKLLSRYI